MEPDWITPIDDCEHYYWNEEVSPHAVTASETVRISTLYWM